MGRLSIEEKRRRLEGRTIIDDPELIKLCHSFDESKRKHAERYGEKSPTSVETVRKRRKARQLQRTEAARHAAIKAKRTRHLQRQAAEVVDLTLDRICNQAR